MNKILLIIYIPTIGFQYDIKVSISSDVKTAIKMIIEGINKITFGEYTPNKFPHLYNRRTGVQYNGDSKISDLGFMNGEELILI